MDLEFKLSEIEKDKLIDFQATLLRKIVISLDDIYYCKVDEDINDNTSLAIEVGCIVGIEKYISRFGVRACVIKDANDIYSLIDSLVKRFIDEFNEDVSEILIDQQKNGVKDVDRADV